MKEVPSKKNGENLERMRERERVVWEYVKKDGV